MTVWMVHPLSGDKTIDTTQAGVFGDIQFVNRRYVYMDELEGDCLPQNVTNQILKAVDVFEPDHDYLLIAGDHLQLIAMSAALADRWGVFKVLRYDRKAQGYVPVQIGQ